MSGSWLQRDLPFLTTENCEITSPATKRYNCLAWAAGNNTQWWDPNPLYRWPSDVPREISLDAVLTVYEKLGFTVCIGGEPEEDFEKIAIFAKKVSGRTVPTHAARQLASGKWTSKLGACEDISHETFDAVNGPLYGEAICFMSRRKLAVPEAVNPPSTNG
ncbi:MAG: hypothetical protein JO340_10750 [Acidobacteriaceae bacterium]|nr:hypothetical protein [Acidobacteriaceae bacterium]